MPCDQYVFLSKHEKSRWKGGGFSSHLFSSLSFINCFELHQNCPIKQVTRCLCMWISHLKFLKTKTILSPFFLKNKNKKNLTQLFSINCCRLKKSLLLFTYWDFQIILKSHLPDVIIEIYYQTISAHNEFHVPHYWKPVKLQLCSGY